MNNVIAKLEDMNLVDKFLFDEVMEDTEACQALISILLENETELLAKPETEKELRVSPHLRQVRLDVSLLVPGVVDFNELNDSCFILIAPFDIFGKGLYRYTFEGTCREFPELKIEDGAVRIFINTRGTNKEEFSQEFLDLMEYITESTDDAADHSDSPRIKLIHENVRKIRTSEKMGVKLMQKWEELVYAREEGVALGKAEGLAEGLMEGKITGEKIQLIRLICRKLAKNKTPEVIADELEEDLSSIVEICKAADEFAPDYNCERIYKRLCETS